MAGSTEQWSTDANEVFQIALVQADQDRLRTLHLFHPQFTYPIFGDEESIFGYQGLIIKLRFAAHDLRPNVNISYDKKFPTVGSTAAQDLIKPLKECLPRSAFSKLTEYEKSLQDDAGAIDFRPPGNLAKSYSIKGRDYEIWSGPLSDPDIRRILENMQIFVLFFIEGGSQIETRDVDWTIERWTVYLVYEKLPVTTTATVSPYSFVGYATTYRFYAFELPTLKPESSQPFVYPPVEPASISSLPSRMRISQFLVLPPHQNTGHGAQLYTTIYNATLVDSTVRELTVEDPNEAFDLLRDTNDYLLLQPEFFTHSISINPNPYPAGGRRPKRLPTTSLLNLPKLKELRQKYKIAPRQFARLLEMFLLSQIPLPHRVAGGASTTKLLIQKSKAPDENDRCYYWWRLIVKQRVYKKNRDTLIQIDQPERIEKLDEAVGAVEAEYELLLKHFEAQGEKQRARGETRLGGESSSLNGNRAKRKLVVDDNEDEDGGEVADGSDVKKLKT